MLLHCELYKYVYNRNNNSTTAASLHRGAVIVVIIQRDSVELAF